MEWQRQLSQGRRVCDDHGPSRIGNLKALPLSPSIRTHGKGNAMAIRERGPNVTYLCPLTQISLAGEAMHTTNSFNLGLTSQSYLFPVAP